MKKLIFTVTNDLNYDQRMIRICTSLQMAGYQVLLVGRKRTASKPLVEQPFQQKRLSCFFERTMFFYIEYNIRLFFFLLFKPFDLVCAIDLDTIIPCYFSSVIKREKRVYDAHELFTEMKEVVVRPRIYTIWKWIETFFVPRFKMGYTVNEPIKNILAQKYKVEYKVIQNVPFISTFNEVKKVNFIIYQGAVNEGRSFETLIPAFQWIDKELWIFGEGNFMQQAQDLAKEHKVEDKIKFKGALLPYQLKEITPKALLGITLFENKGLSNYFSLANRFFDYIQSGVPQLCVDYPVYRHINEEYEVAVLITDLSPENIAQNINQTLADPQKIAWMKQNCQKAAQVYNWELEERKLISFYNSAII